MNRVMGFWKECESCKTKFHTIFLDTIKNDTDIKFCPACGGNKLSKWRLRESVEKKDLEIEKNQQ
jgi:rRNA maturation endonuclease Nob1